MKKLFLFILLFSTSLYSQEIDVYKQQVSVLEAELEVLRAEYNKLELYKRLEYEKLTTISKAEKKAYNIELNAKNEVIKRLSEIKPPKIVISEGQIPLPMLNTKDSYFSDIIRLTTSIVISILISITLSIVLLKYVFKLI